jgi:hypothetical protein
MKWSEPVGKGWNSFGVASFLLHVGPSGDGFGGQAFMEHYSASSTRTKVDTQSRVKSGLKVMGYSCLEVGSMSLKTESLGVTSWSNIIICTSLDIQTALRHLSSYHTTIGGSRYPGTCKGNPNSLDEQLFSQDLVRGNPK